MANSTDASIDAQLKFVALEGANAGSDADRKAMASALEGALTSFYASIDTTPELSRHLTDDAQKASAKGAQMDHWHELLDGNFAQSYASYSGKVGQTNQRIGLPADWFCAGYAKFIDTLVKQVVQDATAGVRNKDFDPEALTHRMSFLMRAAIMDIGASITAYIGAFDEKRSVAEAAQAEQEKKQKEALGAISNFLEDLAQRDLSKPMKTDLPGEFAGMASNLNSAVGVIGQTLALADDASATLLDATSLMANDMSSLSEQTSQTSTNLEEASNAMKEVTDSISKSVDDAGRAVKFSEEAQMFTRQTQDIVVSAVDAMSSIETASGEVVDIVSLIDDVSFQTNLLALNASVEAARAGDAGRGFAVVADEVRTLSKKCAEAAQDIRQKVTASADLIQSGGNLVRQVGTALQEIAQRFSDVNETIAGVADRTSDQSGRVSEITTSVHEIDQIAHQNMSLVEKTSKNAAMLKQDMTVLRENLALFDLPEDVVAAAMSEAGMEMKMAS